MNVLLNVMCIRNIKHDIQINENGKSLLIVFVLAFKLMFVILLHFIYGWDEI